MTLTGDNIISKPHTQAPVVGVVGLGLIGGSFAKAYAQAGWRVCAFNRTHEVIDKAKADGVVSAELTTDILSQCALVIVALYPQAALLWLREHASDISPQTIVIDVGGTKRMICNEAFMLAHKYKFHFVGAHPMAGLHHSGYQFATPDLYEGQPCVLVPHPSENDQVVQKLQNMLDVCGFAHYAITTPEDHDKRIAYTSQLAHILSSAYVKSPRALEHVGFSAGSFKDLTRVAQLNEDMWTELFLENADNLDIELDLLIGHLQAYKNALASGDREKLFNLLREGTQAKLKTLELEDKILRPQGDAHE
ncbi:MAG: prephenate dehydrogenase/arogenate dehydrogenase family protein [Eggerthellaceae bacterium]|nr:prephenate dehydrogenase/arogenate dehydrogenase family protein [Eggerthellaceae bacterium]